MTAPLVGEVAYNAVQRRKPERAARGKVDGIVPRMGIGAGDDEVERLRAHEAVTIDVGAIAEPQELDDVVNAWTAMLLVFFFCGEGLAHIFLMNSAHDSTAVSDPVKALDDMTGIRPQYTNRDINVIMSKPV